MRTFTGENINGDYYQIVIPEMSPNPFSDDILTSTKRISISYGADNIDNESIFFPSNVKVEFHTKENILEYLYDPNISIAVYQNGNLRFIGLLDVEDINYSISKNIYKLTFIDKSKALKTIAFDTIEWGGTYNNVVYIEEMLNRIVGEIGYGIELSGTNSVKAVDDVYDYEAPFQNFGTYPSYFFDGSYETLWDVLVAILSSFGLVGYFYADKFRVQPRFYGESSVVDLELHTTSTEIQYIGGYDYIECDIRTGTGTRATFSYDYRDDPTKEPKKKITYKYEVPGGEHPQVGSLVSFTNLYVFVPAYVAGLGNEGFQVSTNGVKINGSSAAQSCWRAVSNSIATKIRMKRKKIRATIFSTNYFLFDNITVLGVRYKIISLKIEMGLAKSVITGLEY